MLEKLLRAKYSRAKVELLREANMLLELLRFQMRLAKDLDCLKPTSYEHGSKLVHEIGALLGGWIKLVEARP